MLQPFTFSMKNRQYIMNVKSKTDTILYRLLVENREKHTFQNPYFFIDLQNKKTDTFVSVFYSGRGDRIRTCGILVPNQALYQTEPHLDVCQC